MRVLWQTPVSVTRKRDSGCCPGKRMLVWQRHNKDDVSPSARWLSAGENDVIASPNVHRGFRSVSRNFALQATSGSPDGRARGKAINAAARLPHSVVDHQHPLRFNRENIANLVCIPPSPRAPREYLVTSQWRKSRVGYPI